MFNFKGGQLSGNKLDLISTFVGWKQQFSVIFNIIGRKNGENENFHLIPVFNKSILFCFNIVIKKNHRIESWNVH